jgi:hypothetical protein
MVTDAKTMTDTGRHVSYAPVPVQNARVDKHLNSGDWIRYTIKSELT